MPSPYTEDTLVQQTTADYLEQELGWESVYAHNREGCGADSADSLLGRASERDVVLTRPLRERLAALNPGLPAEAYEQAERRLRVVATAQTIVAANRECYDLLRDGVAVTFRDAGGRRRQRRLRVVDFDEPENNHFLCVRELWVRGDLYRRRPDIIGFVNGLPLLFIECKNIHRDLKAAFERNYADYRDTVPHLFHHNAVVMFGNGEQARIGSITFLVLTDRDDLDTQIYKTFAGCGVADHDRDPCRAASGDDLRRLLAEHKAHVFSLIQKFTRTSTRPRVTRGATTSSSAATRRTARSTAGWRSTCATPCRTRAASASPARRSSPATRSRGRCSATTSPPTTSSARWRTGPRYRSTTTCAAPSSAWPSTT